jgi:penicillin-binding protein 2
MGPLPLVTPVSRVEAGFFGGAGFYLRVSIFGAVALGALGLLALRLWSLQILQGPHYARLAQKQTFRLVDFPSARGPILDSRGRLLAGTDGRIVLTADAPALGLLDARGRWQPNPRGRFLLRRVARLTGVPLPLLVGRIRSALVRSPFAPAVIVPSLPRDLATYVDERAPVYPGFHVAALPQRSYPQGALGSEFLGLLGEVSAAELKDPSHGANRPGEVIGQSGVEAAYDRLLNGGFQRARVRVDSLGRTIGPLRLIGLQSSRPALELTIDARLQRVAEQAIRDGIQFAHAAGHADADAGAAVVMSPRDGSIYALASYPDFNQIAAARDIGYLGRLLRAADPNLPLVDRATQGLYPTGSTFKPIVAEAALSSGLINPYSILQCTGSLLVGNIVFHNVEPGINAPMNVEQALAQSCDTWFYRLGTQFYWRQQQTGSLDMQNWARRLGLGHPTGLDIPGESAGVVPTPAWLKRTFKDPSEQIWYEGQSVNLSIGQGYLAVTPLQLAIAYSALANGGTVVRPHVGRAVLDGSGRVVRRLRFRPRARLHLTDVWAIRDGLYAATHAAFGTSSAVFGDFPVPVAGKTGTAQTPSGSDHSWYASWAPSNDPRVVVVVLIEHGGFGVQAAAPAAREIYSAFFHVETPRRPRR